MRRKNLIRWLIQGTVMITVLSCVAGRPCAGLAEEDAKQLCRKQGTGIFKINVSATSCHICCLCESGSYKVQDCKENYPTGTLCEPCEFDPEDTNNQSYTTTENYRTQCSISQNETLCEGLQNTHYVMGSPTQSSRCECKKGFYAALEIMKYGCNEHSSCDEGYQPEIMGTSSSDTMCQPCPPGTFSNVSSPSSMCLSFSKCAPDQIILQQGTKKQDVVCTDKSKTRTPNPTTDTTEKPSGLTTGQIVGLCIVIGLVIFAIIVVVLICCRVSKAKERKKRSSSIQNQQGEEEHFLNPVISAATTETATTENDTQTQAEQPGTGTQQHLEGEAQEGRITETSEASNSNWRSSEPTEAENNAGENESRQNQSPEGGSSVEHTPTKQRNESKREVVPLKPPERATSLNVMSSEMDSSDEHEFKNCLPLVTPPPAENPGSNQQLGQDAKSILSQSNGTLNCHATEKEKFIHQEVAEDKSRNNQIEESRACTRVQNVNADEPSYSHNLELFEYKEDKAIVSALQPRILREALRSNECQFQMLYGDTGLQENLSTSCLKKFIRQNRLVKENDIECVEQEWPRNQNEQRRRLLQLAEQNQSTNLSPRVLLKQASNFQDRVVYDKLCKAFIVYVGRRERGQT